ncbi:hypothetical protein QBC39DRAFT_76049 [Podospora conica]|nr:hypothetical protein QBC39DRAFT_76049 [Schizothecium conicum]
MPATHTVRLGQQTPHPGAGHPSQAETGFPELFHRWGSLLPFLEARTARGRVKPDSPPQQEGTPVPQLTGYSTPPSSFSPSLLLLSCHTSTARTTPVQPFLSSCFFLSCSPSPSLPSPPNAVVMSLARPGPGCGRPPEPTTRDNPTDRFERPCFCCPDAVDVIAPLTETHRSHRSSWAFPRHVHPPVGTTPDTTGKRKQPNSGCTCCNSH